VKETVEDVPSWLEIVKVDVTLCCMEGEEFSCDLKVWGRLGDGVPRMVSASAIARQIERVDRRSPVKLNRGTKYFEETLRPRNTAVLRPLDKTPSSDLPSNHLSYKLANISLKLLSHPWLSPPVRFQCSYTTNWFNRDENCTMLTRFRMFLNYSYPLFEVPVQPWKSL
jgi:hypothetical protein